MLAIQVVSPADPAGAEADGWSLAGLETEPPCPPRSTPAPTLPRPPPGEESPDWRRVLGSSEATRDPSWSDPCGEPRLEAPPVPARRVPDTYPPASTPAPHARIEPVDYAGPIRVRVPAPAPTEGEPEEIPAEPPPPSRALVPDTHREAWLLEQILDVMLEVRAFVSWIRPIQDYLAKGVELLERIDARDAARLREASATKAAESAALASRPRVLRLLDHSAAKPALGLLTWLWGGLSGALLVGLLDYLGAETEPVTRFLLSWLGLFGVIP